MVGGGKAKLLAPEGVVHFEDGGLDELVDFVLIELETLSGTDNLFKPSGTGDDFSALLTNLRALS